MQPGGAVYTEDTKEMLRQIDVLVDGEFVEAKKDLTLIFRGSSNQRIMCLKDGEFAGMWQKQKMTTEWLQVETKQVTDPLLLSKNGAKHGYFVNR